MFDILDACAVCNRAERKRRWISFSIGEFTRFFNPRTEHWPELFKLEGSLIQPLTTIGEVTARVFGFNDSVLHVREEMIRFGKYPSEASTRISSN